ncbi:imidazolonepropionase-like amidohydrolase [Sphingomonas zeicaulis]|uniref:amidohydrolase family protein n=1 Tax=Sphingomonas zeicaulis TaxID=1632740 RepID=UPI003D249A46
MIDRSMRAALTMLAAMLAALLLPMPAAAQDVAVVEAGRLFDGRAVIENARMVMRDGRIVAVGPRDEVAIPEGAAIIDRRGRFVMPGLIAGHSHVGTVSGVEHGGRYYSRETVARDLAQFQRYGVVAVNALGMNRPLFHDLRREFRGPSHVGADLYGAGPGIGVIGGAPPEARMNTLPDQVARPANAEEARAAVRSMADAGVDVIKIWLDALGTGAPKMPPEIYTAVIAEGHARGLPVAAHIRDLADAKAVLAAGADIIGHGVRDQPVDDAFIALLRDRGAWYMATINIDEANYLYAEHPEWLDDPFFRQALNPALEARLRDAAWRRETLAGADGARKAVAMNIANLRALHAAGVHIGLGTDSGGTALRIPGFAEHRELQLSVQAGLTPTEALTAATWGNAQMLRLEGRGTLTPGAVADFLVLDADATKDIGATRTLREVWRSGKKVAR